MQGKEQVFKGIVAFDPKSSIDNGFLILSNFDASSVGPNSGSRYFEDCSYVTDFSLTVTIPADFDPRAAMIAGLKAQREKIRAEFSERIAQINDQISKLTAIEHQTGDAA